MYEHVCKYCSKNKAEKKKGHTQNPTNNDRQRPHQACTARSLYPLKVGWWLDTDYSVTNQLVQLDWG